MATINVPLTDRDQEIIFAVYPALKAASEAELIANIKQQAMSRAQGKAQQFAEDWVKRQAESGTAITDLPNPLNKEATMDAYLAHVAATEE